VIFEKRSDNKFQINMNSKRLSESIHEKPMITRSDMIVKKNNKRLVEVY